MFHVELRQFPTATRAFNLTREELDARVLAPWLRGDTVELNEHRFSPAKARLAIYEGPELTVGEMGIGRGWGNVTRAGRDVTEQLIAAGQEAAVTPAAQATAWLKEEILRRVAAAPVHPHQLLRAMNERYATWRVSDRIAVAESAVWELLHQRRIELLDDGTPLPSGQWEAIVLSWEVWSGSASEISLRLPG
jgi:hypothetical protein